MKEFIKRNIKFIILVIVCMVGSFVSSAFATNGLFDSKQVDYDNSNSHITSTNVGDAIDEVFQHATDYNEIKTTIGNSTLTTTNKTLTGAVNEVNGKVFYEEYGNIDNMTNPGIYYGTYSGSIPSDIQGHGTLLVSYAPSPYLIQLLIAQKWAGSLAFYYRTKGSSTWNGWVKIH